jgi:hypothetical protein
MKRILTLRMPEKLKKGSETRRNKEKGFGEK